MAGWQAASFAKYGVGYQKIQQTRPQTLSYGLNDSPVGLCAWVVEKFREWSDCQGDVLKVFTKEELLTNGTSIVKAKANDKGRIDFSLEAAIDSSVRATPERLRELGSEGLARRYELLREQGFDL